jgi:[ribosomal protein S5]-alanine N-acetyltransferase
MHTNDILIRTERLALRKLSIVDAKFMFQLMNSPNWLKYIGDRHVRTKTEASNYISQKIIPSYHNNGFGLYLVCLNSTETPIGICGLVLRDGLGLPDIGFALLPIYEGKGYSTEAAEAVLYYSANKLSIQEVGGITTSENIGSIKVLEKIGLQFQSTLFLPGDETEFMFFKKDLLIK